MREQVAVHEVEARLKDRVIGRVLSFRKRLRPPVWVGQDVRCHAPKVVEKGVRVSDNGRARVERWQDIWFPMGSKVVLGRYLVHGRQFFSDPISSLWVGGQEIREYSDLDG